MNQSERYSISIKHIDDFKSSSFKLLYGTSDEQVGLFSKGWINDNISPIFNGKQEEMITNVAYCQGVVAWTTRSNIKLRDLQYDKRIGLFDRPELPSNAIDKLVKESNSFPCIIFKERDKNTSIFAFSWIYVLRIYLCSRNINNQSVSMSKIHEFSFDAKTWYLSGFTFIDENYLYFEFNEDEPYKPYFSIYSENNELLYKDWVKNDEIFTKFKGIHYRTVTMKEHSNNGQWIFYNPESVHKVQPVTLKERVLFLLSKRRISECIELVNLFENTLPSDIVLKVRNAHLDQLLAEKHYDEAAKLLNVYLKDNIVQWEHWINRFKQK